MEERNIVLTTDGYAKLEEELKYLKGPKKMEVAERIKIAREFGDLSENSEYDDAKNEQALLEARIQEIEAMLRVAKVVDDGDVSTRKNENLDRFVDELNNNLGTTIQILDKIELKYYNILLVFSQEYINIKHNSSFVLDYNNSNLDVKSNTYLVYINNKEKIEMLLRKLDINSQNFKCTKLGKLCIHLKWNNA